MLARRARVGVRLFADGPRRRPRVVYFGTILIELQTRRRSNPEQIVGAGWGKFQFQVKDEDRGTFAAPLALNPTLAGLDYYDLPAGEVRRVGEPVP